jgi:site-specific recombinase XerD
MKESFFNYIVSRGYSQSTLTGYKFTLGKFEERLAWIGKSIDDPENIKLVDIYNFIEKLNEDEVSPRTRAWIIDWVRGYLKYCKEIVELNIMDLHKIKSPKVPDREIWFFNKEQKEQILKLFNKWVGKSEIVKLRNKLLTYMLLHTGLRCHEIAKIKVCEIWESLQVIWKWGRRRFVFLRKEILDLIYLYLGRRKRKSDFLFDWTKGHLTTDRIRRIFNTQSKKLWFRIHTHKFRHTFATDLLHVPWANIFAVSKLLGHKKITTTQIYLGTDNSELKKIQFWLSF